MTNKEDGDARDGNPRMAALQAVHLVSQILDEAYVIANAAKETGQPWRNLSMLKSFKISRLTETDDEDSFEASKGDCDLSENKAEIVANVVATSTPQKLSSTSNITDETEVSPSILQNDNTFIGQGDEDVEAQQIDLAKSTSMFINHLFDMSDVEHIGSSDDTEILQNASPNDMIAEAMNKIVESYVANNLIPLEAFSLVPDEIIDGAVTDELSRCGNSEYFTTDTLVADINRDVAFYIDGTNSRDKLHDISLDMYHPTVVEEIEEVNYNEQMEETKENEIPENDVHLYENAYATLNRDFDQGSEEDEFPILQDPKGMTLQEVELMTANTSDEEAGDIEIKKEQKPKETNPALSGASGSRKSTLARRCRTQGARFLACLRGWWRRKTPGHRKKDSRVSGVPGMCPLSPDARRRASSLLDNRLLRSPSPSRPVIWKFNTVNETLVNSNRWKEYTFDSETADCGEPSCY